MFLHFGILLLLSQGLLGEVYVSEAIDGDNRIIGGQDATPGMANYQISIRIHNEDEDYEEDEEFHDCGGSILNEEYVLTAAHCVYEQNRKEMSIVVGTHMINKGGDRYKIKKLIPHEMYSRSTLQNDIAIIQIEGKFKYSDAVQPVELLNEKVPVGKKCILTGWGLTNFTKQTSPNNLQMLEYETISNDACSKQIRSSLYAGQLCAKRPNHKGACSGDSGGPLVIQDDKNKTVQIGVASWVVSPCASNYPDVFNSVHGFYDWIQRKIK